MSYGLKISFGRICKEEIMKKKKREAETVLKAMRDAVLSLEIDHGKGCK